MEEDAGSVAVFIALLNTLEVETSCHMMGRFSEVADCKTNPAGDAGQDTSTFVPLRAMDKITGEKSNASA